MATTTIWYSTLFRRPSIVWQSGRHMVSLMSGLTHKGSTRAHSVEAWMDRRLLHTKLLETSESPQPSSTYVLILLALHKTGTSIFKILGFQERKKIRKIYHTKVISISAALLCLGRSQSLVIWKRGGSSWHREPQIRGNKWRLGIVRVEGCRLLLSCLFHINSHVQRKSEWTSCWERCFRIWNVQKSQVVSQTKLDFQDKSIGSASAWGNKTRLDQSWLIISYLCQCRNLQNK